MALVPVSSRNRINPTVIPTILPPRPPDTTFDQVAICNDPHCQVCQTGRLNRHHKRHHLRRKHKRDIWQSFLPRAESASSGVTIHSIELNEQRPYYSSYVRERSPVPVNHTERQVVSARRPRRLSDDHVVRNAWVICTICLVLLIKWNFFLILRLEILLLMMKSFVVEQTTVVDVLVGVVLY